MPRLSNENGGITNSHLPRANDSVLQERRHRQQMMITELARQRQMDKEERRQRKQQQQLLQNQQEQEKFFASRRDMHDIMATVMPETSVSQRYDPLIAMSTPNNGDHEQYFALHNRVENANNHDDDFEMYDDLMDDNDSIAMMNTSNDDMNDSVEMSGLGAQNIASSIETRNIDTPMGASMGKARNYKLKSILRKRGTGQISRSEDGDNDDVTGSVAKKRVVFQDHVDEIRRSPLSVSPPTSSEYRRTRDHIATPISIRKQNKSIRRQSESRSHAGSTRLRQNTRTSRAMSLQKGIFKSPSLSDTQDSTGTSRLTSDHAQNILATCHVPILEDTISSISHEAGDMKKQIKAGRIGFSTPKSHRIQKAFLMHGEDISAREARASEILSTAARRKHEESDTSLMREAHTDSTAETKTSTAKLSNSAVGASFNSTIGNGLPPSASDGKNSNSKPSESKFSAASFSSPSAGNASTFTLATPQPPASLTSSSGTQTEKSEKRASSTTNVNDLGSSKQANISFGGTSFSSTPESGDQQQSFSFGTKPATISTKVHENKRSEVLHSSANDTKDQTAQNVLGSSFGTNVSSFNPSTTDTSSTASSATINIKDDAKPSVSHETTSSGFSISGQAPDVQDTKTGFSFGGSTQVKTPMATNHSDTNSNPSFAFGVGKDSKSASTEFSFNQNKSAAPVSDFGFGSGNTNTNETSLKVGTSGGNDNVFGTNFTMPSSNNSNPGVISGKDSDAFSKIVTPGAFGSTGFSAPSNSFGIGTAVFTKDNNALTLGTTEATPLSIGSNVIGSSNNTTSTAFGQAKNPDPTSSTFSFGSGNTFGSSGFNAPSFGQNNITSSTTKSANDGEKNRKIVRPRSRKRDRKSVV